MRNLIENQFKNDRYQVFVMASRATMPFSFALHPWFVINRKGMVSRFGVSWRDSSMKFEKFFKTHTHEFCKCHLHKNAVAPSEGVEIFMSSSRRWQGKIIAKIEGDELSLAARMSDFIENSPSVYPYSCEYVLRGPNSNTYVAWVLEQFPEAGIRLPWNAFGKKYGE